MSLHIKNAGAWTEVPERSALYVKVNGAWSALGVQHNEASGGVESYVERNGVWWKVHDFTTGGTLTVTKNGAPFRVLAVGAGSTGGNRGAGAGGEVIDRSNVTLPLGANTVVVAPSPVRGTNGTASSIASVSARGATAGGEHPNYASGTSGNGNVGGAANGESSGGGGGAAGVGLNAPDGSNGGKGGPGVSSDILGTALTFGAGGGGQGGGQPGDSSGGVGESPRGGAFNPLTHAPANRGGGGGAGYGSAPGNGGSGRIVVAYEDPTYVPPPFNDATGGTISEVLDYNGTGERWRIHRFAAGAGTLTVIKGDMPFRVVMAGGAQGGHSSACCGSCAGPLAAAQVVENKTVTLTVGDNAASIGGGGAGGPWPAPCTGGNCTANNGAPGGNSTFAGMLAYGGGQNGTNGPSVTSDIEGAGDALYQALSRGGGCGDGVNGGTGDAGFLIVAYRIG